MPRRPRLPDSRYTLESVSRACEILQLFDDGRQALSLTEIVKRTGLEQTICFRLLRTLEERGLLRRGERRKYASNVRILSGKRFRIGYAAQNQSWFCVSLAQGLRWAAAEWPIDIIEMDNKYSAKTALRNAEQLVSQHIDLAIEFQTYERIGGKLSRIFEKAGVPLVAIDIPHPNAAFLGVDNQRAGAAAGRALVKATQKQWGGKCEEILFLDLAIAGSLPHVRISSAQNVLRGSLSCECTFVHLDSRGEFLRGFELTRRHLRKVSPRRTLLTGINDEAVLGALRAFEEVGRSNLCIAVGHGGGPEARRELRLPHSRLAATVAYFPERYGESLVRLALDILNKRATPPAVYIPVQVLTSKNVDEFYPQDHFANSAEGE